MTKNFDLGQHLTRSAVNVLDVGAKGDGITDDTAAIEGPFVSTFQNGARMQRDLLLPGIAVPATLAGFNHLFVDTADGLLKFKNAAGVLKTVTVA